MPLKTIVFLVFQNISFMALYDFFLVMPVKTIVFLVFQNISFM